MKIAEKKNTSDSTSSDDIICEIPVQENSPDLELEFAFLNRLKHVII